ncbi:NAD-dependent epimerase/dehydratase [Frankia sp. Hr75.2]|nr:NAD-dependent epimerase/dehydratase [Frankia sp. Hr75.2]
MFLAGSRVRQVPANPRGPAERKTNTMALHVITGAGGTGAPTAELLARQGDRVRLVSRRGGGPEHPLIERIAADATDADALTRLAEGATTLINTAMPPYDRWPDEFPPLATALLDAAERTGAGYVMMGNTYGYGIVNGRFTEDLPMAPVSVKGQVRARMWTDALEAHRAGRARVTEVRASAFLGAGAGSLYNFTVAPLVLRGEPAAFPGDLDAPKTWSYIGDAARTLAAVALSGDDLAWGRAWHVPSTAALSVRELTTRLATIAGAPAPILTAMSTDQLAATGAVNPVMREVIEMMYSLEQPDLLDSTLTEQTFRLAPTPLETVLTESVSAYGPVPDQT